MDTCESRFESITNLLLFSSQSSEIQLITSSLLSLHRESGQYPTSLQTSSIIQKLLSSSDPSLRVLGLKLVRKFWTSNSPTSQQIVQKFIQDVDPGVRVAALKGVVSSTNHQEIINYFSDYNVDVQIEAMRLFVKNSWGLDQDSILDQLVPQTFSNSSEVVIETLRLMGTLKLSTKAIQKSLKIDDRVPHSGFLLFVFESEFCDVRIRAIESISSILSRILPSAYDSSYSGLVYLVVKVLLDIINDEFREVRIMVFKFLADLTPYFMLKKKVDVDSCIFNLRDTDPVLRHAIYDFLCKVRIDNAMHAQVILDTLFAMFSTFPGDTDYIYSVSAHMGRQNYRHGKFLLNRLLGVDKRFLSNDHNWNDQIYIAKLIFLVNANLFAKNLEIPNSCEKHIDYLADLYPLHMPMKNTFMDTDLKLPLAENIEFNEKCRKLCIKINKMVKKPHIYFHDSQVYIKYILTCTCELQNCYEIESESQLTYFFIYIKLNAHIIYLLSMLVPSYTGKTYPDDIIRGQLENILKGAALVNNNDLMRLCHEYIHKPSQSQYEDFESHLKPVPVPSKILSKIQVKTAEITFPTGEKVVSECEVLNVQGHGSCSMHCVIELADSTQETAKASYHSNHLNSYIRIHKPSNPISVQICFAVLINLSDFVLGPGLHNETIKMQNFIAVSPHVNLLLKPSITN